LIRIILFIKKNLIILNSKKKIDYIMLLNNA